MSYCGVESHVQSLIQEDINNIRHELLKNWEHNWEKIRVQQRGVALIWSVNPTEQEVMVTIGQAFDSLEPLIGSSLVENGSILRCQWENSHIESSVSSPLSPLREIVSLDTMFWPIPSILLNSYENHSKLRNFTWDSMTFNSPSIQRATVEWPAAEPAPHWMIWSIPSNLVIAMKSPEWISFSSISTKTSCLFCHS